MKCQTCGSTRILEYYVKCTDGGFSHRVGNRWSREDEGVRVENSPLGDCEEVEANLCLDCGQMQGKWPYPELIGLEVDAPEREYEETPINRGSHVYRIINQELQDDVGQWNSLNTGVGELDIERPGK